MFIFKKSGTQSKRSNYKRETIQVKRVGAVIGSLRFPSARPSPGSVTGLACEIYPASHVYIDFYIMASDSILLSSPNLYYYKNIPLYLVLFFLDVSGYLFRCLFRCIRTG